MANLPDSTLDPVFWLHHGVVDFMFTFWQARSETTIAIVRSTEATPQAWQHNNEQTHPTCRSCSTCAAAELCKVFGRIVTGSRQELCAALLACTDAACDGSCELQKSTRAGTDRLPC